MSVLAKFISTIFGLPVTLGIAWLLVMHTGLSDAQIRIYSILFPVTLFLIPTGYLIKEMREGDISDIDVTDRKERYGIMTVILVMLLLTMVGILYVGNTYLFSLFLALFAAFGSTYIITFFWKISMHMTFNTMFLILLHLVSNGAFPFSWLLLPVVAWSRHVLKKHTPAQLILGVFLPGGVMLGVLRMMGLY